VLASFDEPKRLVIWCRKSYFLFVLVAEELGSFGSPDIASVLVFYSSLVFPSCRDSSPMSPSICGGGIPCATFFLRFWSVCLLSVLILCYVIEFLALISLL